jgi:hypothetical protein
MALDLASETNLLQVSHRSRVRVSQLVRVNPKRLQKSGQFIGGMRPFFHGELQFVQGQRLFGPKFWLAHFR